MLFRASKISAVLFLLFVLPAWAQTYQVPSSGRTTIAACSGTVVDSGDIFDYHDVDALGELVIYPDQKDVAVRLEVLAVGIDPSDRLDILAGAPTSSPLLSSPGGGIQVGDAALANNGVPALTVQLVTSTSGPNDLGFELAITCEATPEYLIDDVAAVDPCTWPVSDSGGSSGNYQNGESFVRTFSTGPGAALSYTFDAFDLENQYDFLRIYDGPSTSSPLLATLTGSTLPSPVDASGTEMTFEFTSDPNVTRAGWKGKLHCFNRMPTTGSHYRDVPGSHDMFDSQTAISKYGANENGILTVTPRPLLSHRDRGDAWLYVAVAQLGSGDSLEIYGSGSSQAPLLGTLTGSSSQVEFGTAGSDEIRLEFSSDATDHGWWLAVLYESIVQGDRTFSTCALALSDSGTVNGQYSNSETSTLVLVPDNPAARLSLEFVEFATEPHFDRLSVYDGPSTASPLIGTYSGTTNPGTLYSTQANGGALTLHYTSDLTVVDDGWKAIARCDLGP